MVKVVISRQLDGTPQVVEEHPAGASFIARDGLLGVLDASHRDANTIAMYAPGAWSSVEVVAA